MKESRVGRNVIKRVRVLGVVAMGCAVDKAGRDMVVTGILEDKTDSNALSRRQKVRDNLPFTS